VPSKRASLPPSLPDENAIVPIPRIRMQMRHTSNLATTFVPIRFNGIDDDWLSVVFARITRPKDSTRDSHNLGKTTLIHLIDFLLLKDVSEKNSFLLKHLDRFQQFVFYIELRPHAGGYITIRRGVQEPTKISVSLTFYAHRLTIRTISKSRNFCRDEIQNGSRT
jgi:uncharacterized protein YydD (DUF2326 family)